MVVAWNDRTWLGEGLDSAVFLLKDKNCVMKIYDRLKNSFLKQEATLNDCLDAVQLYNADTLKAKKVLESEWDKLPEDVRKTVFRKNVYGITITILLQGEAQIRKEFMPSSLPEQWNFEHIDYVVSEGQTYISTLGLDSYIESFGGSSLDDKPLNADFSSYELLDACTKDLKTAIFYLEQVIRNNVGVPFRVVHQNIKPVIDVQAKKIDLIVTDLAKCIVQDYHMV
jgi:hypothetical protein